MVNANESQLWFTNLLSIDYIHMGKLGKRQTPSFLQYILYYNYDGGYIKMAKIPRIPKL
jgi:hypothetical protein